MGQDTPQYIYLSRYYVIGSGIPFPTLANPDGPGVCVSASRILQRTCEIQIAVTVNHASRFRRMIVLFLDPCQGVLTAIPPCKSNAKSNHYLSKIKLIHTLPYPSLPFPSLPYPTLANPELTVPELTVPELTVPELS